MFRNKHARIQRRPHALGPSSRKFKTINYPDDHAKLSPYIYHRTILTRAWTLGSYVKQQYDVGLSFSLLATRPWLFENQQDLFGF